MPARRRTAAAASSSRRSSGGDEPEKNEVAYRIKRQRNNDAVKKTREKSKKSADARKQHVEQLSRENQTLQTKIDEVKRHVQCLKDLVLHNVDPKSHDTLIKKILEEKSDDEDASTEAAK